MIVNIVKTKGKSSKVVKAGNVLLDPTLSNTSPNPPTLAGDDVNNTLVAFSPLGITEILYNENNGPFQQYTGTIYVGDVARVAGYWKFKIKSTTGRNESAIVNSPAFTVAAVASTQASFTLTSPATTSAGVYKTDNTLVRTLWSGKSMLAGTYPVKWDGTDDFGQPLPVDSYIVKVLSNNVTYQWQGTIGNSSTNIFGLNSTIHRSFNAANKILIVGGNAYYTVGYNEKEASHFQFALSNPQVKLDPFNGLGNQTTDYACTDGTNIYWAAWDNYQDAYSWVYATKISDNSLVNFSSGVPFKAKYGKDYPSVLDLKAIQAKPSGITVSSNYLFISYQALGYITVLNKNTGAFVRNVNMTNPTAMAVDGSNIWVTTATNTLQKYPINGDGSFGLAITSVAGLTSPVDVVVNGGMLAVVDGGISQQIKTFSTSSGASIWNFGQPGGQLTSPVVSNDRFGFWRYDGGINQRELKGSIAFASDGSFWICDPSNQRFNHYDANRNFIESIIYQGATYACFADPNNHARLGYNLKEFEVNYTSSDIKTAWTLKYNWEGTWTSDYVMQEGIRNITTLSNNRTYALVRKFSGGLWEIVELSPTTGLRFTGITFDIPTAKLYADGSIYGLYATGIGETATWQKKTLNGFDGSNNPIYSNFVTILSNSVTDAKQPRLSGPKILPYEKTSSNVLVNFRGSADEGNEPIAFHLGGMNATTGQWLWKASPNTFAGYQGEYPNDGYFDIGNGVSGYAGNVAMAMERSIIWGYNGEFWKGSQVNKWNHYYDNGLFVGQYGKTGPEYNDDPINNAAFAGNAFSPAIVKESNDYYMYHNDESVHGGILRWKISGINTIQEQAISLSTSFIRAAEVVLPGVDLMAGIPDRSNLVNGSGWAITPALINPTWVANTRVLTYDKRKSPDLYVIFNPSTTGVNSISRALGSNTNLTSWEITGNVAYNTSEPNSPDGLGLNQYLDVLDNLGKIIVRFYQKINYSTGVTNLYANNTSLLQKDIVDMKAFTKTLKPLSLVKSGSSIIVTFAGQSITISAPFDTGANLSNPTSFRLYFNNTGGVLYQKTLGISDLRFNNTTQMT